MKKILLLATLAIVVVLSSCEKDKPAGSSNEIPSNLPRTAVPAEMQGMWMYGNFSTTEFWSRNPAEYLGNALTMAIAFKLNSDGTYEQYFTSSNVLAGIATYQQSVTRGTVTIDAASNTFTTHPFKAHYKRSSNGQTLEERDLRPDEVSSVKYFFEAGEEPNGTKALYLTLDLDEDPIAFLKK